MVSTFKVAIVKRQANAVEPKALEESSIRVLEERLEELHHTRVQLHANAHKPCATYLIEEILRIFFSDGFSEGLSNLEFASGISCTNDWKSPKGSGSLHEGLTANEIFHAIKVTPQIVNCDRCKRG